MVENTGLLAAVAAAVKSLRLALVVDLVDRMQVLELELHLPRRGRNTYPHLNLLLVVCLQYCTYFQGFTFTGTHVAKEAAGPKELVAGARAARGRA